MILKGLSLRQSSVDSLTIFFTKLMNIHTAIFHYPSPCSLKPQVSVTGHIPGEQSATYRVGKSSMEKQTQVSNMSNQSHITEAPSSMKSN